MSDSEVLYVRSSKKDHKSNEDDTSTNDDDVWDDSILIEAYDKAVNLAQNEVLKKMQESSERGKSSKKTQWQIGDKCRCEYSEDHIYYEADIIDIIDDVGKCIVKYVGYENEEKVSLHKLKPSKGDMARSMQIHQALLENKATNDSSVDKGSESEKCIQFRKKKSEGKRTIKGKNKERCGHPGNVSSDSMHKINADPGFMSIPPPPPPYLFENPSEDITESDAMNAMLMAWYMSGYHTGYYQGLKSARKK